MDRPEERGCYRNTNLFDSVGLEVLYTPVVMKSYVVWDITPCGPLKVNRSFGGTRRPRLQGRRISQAILQVSSFFQADFLLGLFFEHEDLGVMFLRNVG
jgi:hypothetical protein